MAPVRTANRRAQRDHTHQQSSPLSDTGHGLPQDIFIDPMMGTALQIYVEKDVENRDAIVDVITTHGGIVSPGYSGVPYVLVDPHRESGQSLFRQYVGKKGKIVLDAKWAIECANTGQLQTYHTNWAGYKVTGKEQVIPIAHHAAPSASSATVPMLPGPDDMAHHMQQSPAPVHPPQILESHHPPPIPPPISAAATDPLVHHAQHAFQYAVYGAPSMHPPTAAPPQSWQAANGIAPSQTHMQPPPPHMMPHDPYRDGETAWGNAYNQPPAHTHPPHPGTMVPPPPGPEYDYRYREDQRSWVPPPEYYQQPYEPAAYSEQDAYMRDTGPPTTESSAAAAAGEAEATALSTVSTETTPMDRVRGRKRIRVQPQPAPPASTLVVNRRNPPTRSPTPPMRVIKSTYGGNLFTSDDVMYLKRYIDYCQEQGLVLSLREICERIAVKAPHHTFYSWRRYCNKHQIRLGGYAMDILEADEDLGNNEPEPLQQRQSMEQPLSQEMAVSQQEHFVPAPGAAPSTIAVAKRAAAADVNRTRSPTPPRALFRSTTGKGVAFTEEDVTFLVRFFEYRNRALNGKVDMVTFWKDVAAKAPHHSRASWMKFYRRHKHELHYEDGDAPLPAPPEKKMRYSPQDDVLLAKYFYHKPEGTSDRIFQDFGRLHPHHPWKGWQEHHRIHKTKIDYLIEQLEKGENIDVPPDE